MAKGVIADLEVLISANTTALNSIPQVLGNLDKTVKTLDASVKKLASSLERDLVRSSKSVASSNKVVASSAQKSADAIAKQQTVITKMNRQLIATEKEFNKYGQAGKAAFQNVSTSARAATAALSNNGKVTKSTLVSASVLKERVERFGLVLDKNKTLLNANSQATTTLGKASQGAAASIDKIQTASIQAGRTVSNVNARFKEMRGGERNVRAANKALENFNRTINKTGVSAAQVAKAQATLGSRMAMLQRRAALSSDKIRGLGLSFTELSKSAQIALGPLSGVASRITAFAALGGSRTLLFAGILSGFIGLGVFIGKAVKAASEFEKQFLRIGAILRATGRDAELSATQVNKVAEAIGRDTLTSATKARDALGALLTLQNAPNTEAFLRQAGLAAQGLSLLGRGDIVSNMRKLKRIFEEPAQSLKSLSDAGIFFSAQQERMIVNAQEQGRIFEAQQIVMDNLIAATEAATKETGGLAGAADTAGEAWTKLKEVFANSSGIIGLVTGAVQFLTFSLGGLTQFIDDQISVFPRMLKFFQDLKNGTLGFEIADKPSGFFDFDASSNKVMVDRAKATDAGAKSIAELVKEFAPFVRANEKADNAAIKLRDVFKNLSDSQLVDLQEKLKLGTVEFKRLAKSILELEITAGGKFIVATKDRIQALGIETKALKLRGAEGNSFTDELKAAQAIQAAGLTASVREAFNINNVAEARREQAREIRDVVLAEQELIRVKKLSTDIEGLKDNLSLLVREGQLIGGSNVARRKALALLTARIALQRLGLKFTKENNDLWGEFLKITRQIEDQTTSNLFKEQKKDLRDILTIQKGHMNLLLLTNELRERQLAIVAKRVELERTFGVGPRADSLLDDFVKTLANKKIIDDFTKGINAIENAFDSVAISLNDLLVDGLKEGETFAERFRDIFVTALKDIQKELFKTFVLQPLKNSLSQSLANAFPDFGGSIAGINPVNSLGTLGATSANAMWVRTTGGGGFLDFNRDVDPDKIIPGSSSGGGKGTGFGHILEGFGGTPATAVGTGQMNFGAGLTAPASAVSSSAKWITASQEATTKTVVKATEAVTASVDKIPTNLSTLFGAPSGPFKGFDDVAAPLKDFSVVDNDGVVGKLTKSQIEVGRSIDEFNKNVLGLSVNARSSRLANNVLENSLKTGVTTSAGGGQGTGTRLQLRGIRLTNAKELAKEWGLPLEDPRIANEIFTREIKGVFKSIDPQTARAGATFLDPTASLDQQNTANALFSRSGNFGKGPFANDPTRGFGQENFPRLQDNANRFKSALTQTGGGVFGGSGVFGTGGGSSGLDIAGLQENFDNLSASMEGVPNIFDQMATNLPSVTSGLTQVAGVAPNLVTGMQTAATASTALATVKGIESTVSTTAATAKTIEATSGQAAAAGLTSVASAAPGAAASLSIGSSGLGGAGIGGGGGLASFLPLFFHKGGVVGREGRPTVSLPKFHEGLAPDEFRAVLRRNEAVFTPEQLKVLGVAMSSGGRDSSSRGGAPTIINNFTTPDPDSFRRTEAQVGRRMAREIELSSRAS